jgi:hypothetical protein
LHQPTALLRTLANLKSTRSQTAHGRIYNDSDVLLQEPAAAAAAAAARGNGPIYGAGGAFQGHRNPHVHLPTAVQLPAVQIPQQALQKEEEVMPLVESTSECENDEFKNALDRTIIQSSDNDKTPPTRTPPTPPTRPRRQRTSPTGPASPRSPAAGPTGARPRTPKQTLKDGDKLGKLHDQPYPQERKKYERKKK